MIPWMKLKIYGSRQRLSSMWRTRTDDAEKDSTASKGSSHKGADKLHMSIIGDNGTWMVHLGPDTTVEKVKTMALTHFYSAGESVKLAPKYKLVSVADKKPLLNSSTLMQEHVKTNDELLLVEMYNPMNTKEQLTAEMVRGPTPAQINAATHAVKERNLEYTGPKVDTTDDFQQMIQRVLITLCEASAKLLSPTADAERVTRLVLEQMAQRRSSELNPVHVKAIMDMGYTRDQATRGLRRNHFNHRKALDWLAEHGNEPMTDAETQEAQPSTSHSPSQTLVQAVDSMLARFRSSRREAFTPDPSAVKNLMEMGFGATEVDEALRVAGNNQNAACDWLLGTRTPTLKQLECGLSVDHPLFCSIMDTASVQLSLSKPRVLLAFLSILDNVLSIDVWLNDPEVAPVLNTLFRIYHSERHVTLAS